MPHRSLRHATVRAFFALGTLGLALLLEPACRPVPADCSNGECVCEAGARCDFECQAPPCHVDCAGDNPECVAVCGNGDCRCGAGSSCEFECQSPPCHVRCEVDTECSGTCANGDCTCVAGSRCDFACDAGPCHVTCEGGHDQCAGRLRQRDLPLRTRQPLRLRVQGRQLPHPVRGRLDLHAALPGGVAG